MSDVAHNVAAIRERMRRACVRAGRDPFSVELVGVTKTVPIERIREGVKAGLTILGENYIQEAKGKVEALADLGIVWHFIGHLQSNKARAAVQWCGWIHTVDRVSLAVELDRQARKQGKIVPILIQVNVGDEASKSGVAPEGLFGLFDALTPLEGIEVRGLMTLPPYFEDAERVRPFFQQLRTLLERLKDRAPHPEKLTELSMGMSNDFEVAIEEGATLVRVGTALFGARPTATP